MPELSFRSMINLFSFLFSLFLLIINAEIYRLSYTGIYTELHMIPGRGCDQSKVSKIGAEACHPRHTEYLHIRSFMVWGDS